MELADELRLIAESAVVHADTGENLAGVVPAEPAPGMRLYLCAFGADGATTSWLVLDRAGAPVTDRAPVRDAVSIAALCELAEETAGAGLDDLRSRLVGLRITENPPGIDDAETAVDELQGALGTPPQVASPARLDTIGSAARRLEQALGEATGSAFVEAMKAATSAVDALVRDVEAGYKRPLG
jgi:hypothetical protein